MPVPRGSRRTTVLLTGATGHIGRVVLADLLDRGYRVRATTSGPVPAMDDHDGVLKWREFDFMTAGGTDYDELVAGCEAVLHLAAEMSAGDRMSRVNADATRLLAEASEDAGVRTFCYTSSIFVYQCTHQRMASEDAPVMTVEHDVPSERPGPERIRDYGRTKLAGERALREVARSIRYVILRPTVVVDFPQIIGVRDWHRMKKILVAHRHAHQIYVRDVSDAVIWAMERALDGVGEPGSVETFNLSEDECTQPRYADFFRAALRSTGDARFRVRPAPGVVDWIVTAVRFRSFSLRNPLWRMRFPSDRLRRAGWSPPFGMAYARAMAIAEVRGEAEWDSSATAGVTVREAG
ncbi:MAG: NAD-dependent epimerase/dehydratase family protein [Actinomycetota bacterium]|nr:NAD-dependent epimerase/dehydratase family protein [Actinomycetota bacterium]